MELICATSADESDIAAWDAATAALITSLRTNACPSRSVAAIGLQYVVALQSNPAKMRLWTWTKGRSVDSVLPEKCVSVDVSRDGTFLFAGGKSGRLYVWEMRSGRMVHSWNAHYRAIGNLKMDPCGSVLLSGGEDAVVHLWLMSQIMDPEPGKSLITYRSWSGHTLPITDMEFLGTGSVSTVVSVSMDCSCQLWNAATGKGSRTDCLPCPLLSVTVGVAMNVIYSGGQNGEIYEIDLSVDNSVHRCFCHRHEGGVVSLEKTPLSERLVSGSLDGNVRVWDVISRQCLRVMELPGKKPVSNVFTLYDPDGRLTDKDATPPLSLVGISKFPGQPLRAPEYPWEGPPIELKGQSAYSGVAHAVLHADPSPLDSIQLHKTGVQMKQDSGMKIPLEGTDTEMLESLDASNLDLKSFVSQVLHKDRATT